jgi:hypothetical protein
MYRIILAILLILPSISYGCRFDPNFRSTPFLVTPSFKEQPVPKPAVVELSYIKRGFDDGDFASCSDAGIIELKGSTNTVGYDISVIEPDEHKRIISDGLYGAVKEDNGFFIRFIWLDGLKDYQDPISLSLEVRAMSITGQLSEPVELEIKQ